MNKIVLLFLFLFLCIKIEYAITRNYFVDASNINGPWDGNSWQTAWKDFSQFNIDLLLDDPIINIAPGVYNFSNYNLPEHKSIIMIRNKQNVTIKKSYPHLPEEGSVTFVGNGGDYDHGIFLYPAFNCQAAINSITIQGITFSEFKRNPINISGTIYDPQKNPPCTLKVQNVTINECYFNNIAVGYTNYNCAAIYAHLSDILTIHKCQINFTGNVNAQTDGIFIDESSNSSIVDNFIYIENNYIPTGEPYHIDCIQFAPTCSTFNVEKNTIVQATTSREDNTGIIMVGAAGDVKILNNNIYSKKSNSLISFHINSDIDVAYIYNNTFAGKDLTGQLVYVTGGSMILNDQKYKIKNNILYKYYVDPGLTPNHDIYYFEGPGYSELNNGILSHNLYYIIDRLSNPVFPKFQIGSEDYNWNDSQWHSTPPNSYNDNPDFFVTNYDYKLNYKSPAKNRGLGLTDIGIVTDRYGNPRPYWNTDFDIGAYEVEDSQLKFGATGVGIQQSVNHTLTAFGNFWERNPDGTFFMSENYALQSATEGSTGNFDKNNLFGFPGVEYDWLDRSHNSSGKKIAAGFYRVTNDLVPSKFMYVDLRAKEVNDYSLNLYLRYNNEEGFERFEYYKKSNNDFLPVDPLNLDVPIVRIWEVNGYPESNSEFWEHGVVVVKSPDNRPLIAWLPFGTPGMLYTVLRSNNCTNPNDFVAIGTTSELYFKDPGLEFCTAIPPVYCDNECNFNYKVSKSANTTYPYSVSLIWGKPQKRASNNLDIPLNFSLEQNYPNPFNPITHIRYSLPEDGLISLRIYDILGKEVATLVNEIKAAGEYEYKFDGSLLASGIYICQFSSGNNTAVKKIQLLK